MKVILTKDVPSLGGIGDLVKVKDGYGRNYLIPQEMAVLANEANRKEFEHKKTMAAAKKEKVLKEYRTLAHKIEKVKVVITKQVGEEDRIFGSVTSAEIAEVLHKEGIDVSRKVITLSDDIKTVGSYVAEVKLHAEVIAKVKVKVEAAASQA
jgi:large subunit ribosomal protein L9